MKPWTTPEEKASARARLAEIDTALEALSIEARTLAYVLALPDAPDRASRLAPMLDALRALPDGSSVRDLAKAAKWGYQKAFLVLQDLVSYGLVEHYARGKYRLALRPNPGHGVLATEDFDTTRTELVDAVKRTGLAMYQEDPAPSAEPTPALIVCIRCGHVHYAPTCPVL